MTVVLHNISHPSSGPVCKQQEIRKVAFLSKDHTKRNQVFLNGHFMKSAADVIQVGFYGSEMSLKKPMALYIFSGQQ